MMEMHWQLLRHCCPGRASCTLLLRPVRRSLLSCTACWRTQAASLTASSSTPGSVVRLLGRRGVVSYVCFSLSQATGRSPPFPSGRPRQAGPGGAAAGRGRRAAAPGLGAGAAIRGPVLHPRRLLRRRPRAHRLRRPLGDAVHLGRAVHRGQPRQDGDLRQALHPAPQRPRGLLPEAHHPQSRQGARTSRQLQRGPRY